jgi:hypothetical protein
VITSTALVIGVVLVIVLGLADRTHFSKAALAGRLPRNQGSRKRNAMTENTPGPPGKVISI